MEIHIWLDNADMINNMITLNNLRKSRDIKDMSSDEYSRWIYSRFCVSYSETIKALKGDGRYIHTTLTHFLQADYIEAGFKMFVHFSGDRFIEVKFGENTWTDREIRPSHNLENLLYSGEMGRIDIN